MTYELPAGDLAPFRQAGGVSALMKPQEEPSAGRPADRRLVGPQFYAGFGNGILLGYLRYGSRRATPDGPLLSHNSM
jgi:hypothetical protein